MDSPAAGRALPAIPAMVRPMMYMELEIREDNVYCELKQIDSQDLFADLRAEKLDETWFVTSSTHPDSEALNDFEAPDQWLASALMIGIARRLHCRILAGEEE